MTKLQMLKIMRLLSALESWAFTQGKPLPDYMLEDIFSLTKTLEEAILAPETNGGAV